MLDGDDWEAWRDVRLRSLQDSPDAFGSTYAREVRLDEPTWRERLDDPTGVAVLASRRGVPVGMGGGYEDLPGHLHVVAMWVAPEARGQRVAHAVLLALEGWAEERRLRLHLDVSTENAPARRSYERFGFVGTGETRPLREGSTVVVERMVSGRRGSR